jgi:hypothetical protein
MVTLGVLWCASAEHGRYDNTKNANNFDLHVNLLSILFRFSGFFQNANRLISRVEFPLAA